MMHNFTTGDLVRIGSGRLTWKIVEIDDRLISLKAMPDDGYRPTTSIPLADASRLKRIGVK